MKFNLDSSLLLLRRSALWVALIALLWVLRDFFHIVFVTFCLIYIASPLVGLCNRYLRMSYRAGLFFVYAIFLLAMLGFLRFLTPGIIDEASVFMSNVDGARERMVTLRANLSVEHPNVNRALRGYLRSLLDDSEFEAFQQRLGEEKIRLNINDKKIALLARNKSMLNESEQESVKSYFNFQDELLIEYHVDKMVDRIGSKVPYFINYLYKITETTVLSLIFSFLILIDKKAIQKSLERLQTSNIGDWYTEAFQAFEKFGQVVGKGIQAQATIALVNATLTLLGLLLLSVPAPAVLTVIVFVCGFVPVVGMFISTIPIVLVSLNSGGLSLALYALVMIAIIHVIEAYVLNPVIYGRHFKMNAVLVLIVLFVAYHFFGIWGMILGVPVSQYLFFTLGVLSAQPGADTRG